MEGVYAMETWYKWGLYFYAVCVLGWLIDYLKNWDGLLWTSVIAALLMTSFTEWLAWRHTQKKSHLVIPVLTAISLVACLCILLQQLL